MFKRQLILPANPKESFFLWGPRQTGKSSLLKKSYPAAFLIDLLKTDQYIKYLSKPSLLREELLALKLDHSQPVIIDEIQKVPLLLDEVHWLIENQALHFALCGSSARKVRKGHANLLGGRAVRYELYGLVFPELGLEWDLSRLLNIGYLPRHYLSENATELLRAYINDYLKEEIAVEGLARNLSTFSEFLRVAALSDTELINFSNIASEVGISSPTVKEYFQILEDTLLGSFLPAYRDTPKRKVTAASKFYFFDVGVVNLLAKRGVLSVGGELFGKALENYIYHEIRAHARYKKLYYEIAYWRHTSDREVDFILGAGEVAVEVKASQVADSKRLKGLRAIQDDLPGIKKRILVCLVDQDRRTEDGIDILTPKTFLERLWAGEIIA